MKITEQNLDGLLEEVNAVAYDLGAFLLLAEAFVPGYRATVGERARDTLPAVYRELFAILDRWPTRAKAIRNAVQRGRLEGGTFWNKLDDCGCFYGHYVNGEIEGRGTRARDFAHDVRRALGLKVDPGGCYPQQTPLEQFVTWVHLGDTPETDSRALFLRDAIEQWAMERGVDLGPRPATIAPKARVAQREMG